MWLLTLLACTSHDSDSDALIPSTVDWSREVPATDAAMERIRGLVPQRSIIHLHSPWSHDACDGEPGPPDLPPDAACLADLREALCAVHVDVAFVTDHPAYAALQPFDDLFMQQPGDSSVEIDGDLRANVIHCADGHEVTWVPGNEDELMPIGLDRQPLSDPQANEDLLNTYTPDAIAEIRAAGAVVLTAHTEGRPEADLFALQDGGLAGTELFNLHAAFDPENRALLGLDPLAWFGDVAPFTSPEGEAEPDLFVLPVIEEQTISVDRWDAMLARGPAVGTAGTDAHQNVLPLTLRDGERGDSYRRMIRAFSNVLLVDGDGPEAAEAAVAAGRSYVAFEVLGVPVGFDVHVEDGAQIVEMGGTASVGTLVVTCPTVSPLSPHGTELPEITATVYKDGEAWQAGCGSYPVETGVYRVRVDITPHHLLPFLVGAEEWDRPYPWVYSNAIRVE